MAYIFTTIGISVINSVVMLIFQISGVIIMNIVIILSAFILELYLNKNVYHTHKIIYDNLEMLRPENEKKLLEEISQKTGRTIFRTKILEIDFKKGVAELDIYYKG
jgi:hypothetical protein